MATLEKAAEIAVKESLGVKKGEKVLIITDENLIDIGRVLYEESKKITDTDIIELPLGKIPGEEPQEEVAKKILEYDVIIIPKNMSYTHTNAVKAACKKGARVATLPGVTKEIMERAINVDYEEMAKRSNKLKDVLDKGKKVRVVTSAGTDITMSIDGREAKASAGMLREKGLLGNLPAGETYIAPVEGTADGKYVIDCSVLKKKVTSPITVAVEDGFAVKIDGDERADELRNVLDGIKDKNAFNIAELGIGTNDKAIVTGNVLEDEKVMGTAHIALGKNFSFGGKVDVPVHIDGVFLKPTIYVDGVKIIEDGKFL
ncbi:aminopeptidase [Candidatus Woesearchaeota archaeon]|nr:aminopeptidase [Candidatus Woesearchaeota archaeon]